MGDSAPIRVENHCAKTREQDLLDARIGLEKASGFTDGDGRLVWGLDLETQMPFASWSVTLTKKGDKEGNPEAKDTTDAQGVGGAGGVKKF